MSLNDLISRLFADPGDAGKKPSQAAAPERLDNHRVNVKLTVNGTVYEREVEARYLLADFLRHELGLKGTHIGCEQGVCGACTVLIGGRTARACLQFAAALEGAEITTVEGIAGDGPLHPIQQAFHENHAVQCGYCTSGFLLTTIEFLKRNPDPTREQVREALVNNVCRCTGYLNIVDAVEAAAVKMRDRTLDAGGEPS
ncbi:MAG: (2Fe-2S)-binding protein [Arenicellales bacterium]|nr:(2Fe-2S)-binding protein [Arenicellales bacterium]|tara:strand:+ start:1195 stop:1791 length:597 start_codon:yes stop_codon:yes gene_type:complete